MKDAAAKARRNSNVKDEAHQIGAAVLGSSGKIYAGCNLLSIPQDVCAERVALYSAISSGETKIKAVLITEKDAPPKDYIGSPCGHCLQDLWTLSNNKNLAVYSWYEPETKPRKPHTIGQLYPYPYTPEM